MPNNGLQQNDLVRVKLVHYKNCTPNYPEKPRGEPARPLYAEPLSNAEVLVQCGDCGASVFVQVSHENHSNI
jgi:hypothetical protein